MIGRYTKKKGKALGAEGSKKGQMGLKDNKRILYVDDIGADANIIASMLNPDDYHVTVVNNGIDALDLIRDENFDLILMDINMPAVDGIETSRAIRDELKLNADTLPIIGLSGTSESEYHGEVSASGINDFIVKPLQRETLQEKIEHWLSLVTKSMKQEKDVDQLNAPILDNDQIKTFIEFVGADRTKEIVDEFVQHYEKHAPIIFDEDKDIEVVSNELHAMASISGNLGLMRFSLTCRALMTRFERGDLDDRMDHLMPLQFLYDESLAELNKLLHSVGDDS